MGRDHTTTKAVTNLAFEPIKDINLHTSVQTCSTECSAIYHLSEVFGAVLRDCEGLKYLHLLTWAIMCSYYSQTSNCKISSLNRKPLSIKHKNYLLILKANTACMENSITEFKGQECTILNTDPEESTLGSIITGTHIHHLWVDLIFIIASSIWNKKGFIALFGRYNWNIKYKEYFSVHRAFLNNT